MPSVILEPTRLQCTGALLDIPNTLVDADKVRCVDVRAANYGAADSTVDLVLTDGATVIYRARGYPVPFQNVGSAPDLEQRLTIPAGWKLQARAGATGVVEVSVTGVEDDA